MLRRLGLRQRIMAILAGGALISGMVVGLSLHELSSLHSLSDIERQAGQRRDAIHEAVTVALQAANAFVSLGLDLTPQEEKEAIGRSEDMLRRFDELRAQIAPSLESILSSGERNALDESAREIRHAWHALAQTAGAAKQA